MVQVEAVGGLAFDSLLYDDLSVGQIELACVVEDVVQDLGVHALVHFYSVALETVGKTFYSLNLVLDDDLDILLL